MTASSESLLQRDLDTVMFRSAEGDVTGAQFLAHVERLAGELPDRACVINYCQNRYQFAVAFFAALARGQCNVLLPGHQPGLLQSALDEYGDVAVVSATRERSVDACWVDPGSADPAAVCRRPVDLPSHQLAARVFTSGTTGRSKPVNKTVRELYTGARINAAEFSSRLSAAPVGIVATVPPWHMYGLEWTVMQLCLSESMAFSGPALFPGDVKAALDAVANESVLVSTPHHLRALLRSGIPLHPDYVMSATAPLDGGVVAELAGSFKSQLMEVYGCSEAGSFAARSPLVSGRDRFRPFAGFALTQRSGTTVLSGAHLPSDVTLPDALSCSDDGSFALLGRDSDLVKVAGKRASLSALNAALLSIDGVVDGMFLAPFDGTERLIVLAVLSGTSPERVQRGLAERIERSFLPRRVRRVAAIPRNETGKVLRAEVDRLLAEEVNTSDSSGAVDGLA